MNATCLPFTSAADWMPLSFLARQKLAGSVLAGQTRRGIHALRLIGEGSGELAEDGDIHGSVADSLDYAK